MVHARQRDSDSEVDYVRVPSQGLYQMLLCGLKKRPQAQGVYVGGWRVAESAVTVGPGDSLLFGSSENVTGYTVP